MRRTDRLFEIIQLLRRKRVVRAAELAEHLEVSLRTIYRDVADLVATGTPIDGEAGVGYSLRSGYDLPPLMFDREEMAALVLGARLVVATGDESLRRASRSVLSKVEAVVPDASKSQLWSSALYAPQCSVGRSIESVLGPARRATEARRKIRLQYQRADEQTSHRVVRPVGIFFWGYSWTLTAWCELRGDFRSFRLDRVLELDLLDDTFEDEPGRTLADFVQTVGGDPGRLNEV